eukprot:g529.t1
MPDIDFYVWDWGNGDRDTVYEVSNYFYTYLFDEATACSAGNDFIVYNISLEIYRFCEEGQSCHTQIAPVAIRFKPRANFGVPPIVCAGDTVALSNESCNGDEFLWVFGDGSTSTEANPEHVFDTAGVYDVSLYVTNACGVDSLSLPVEVLNQPQAVGSANGSDDAIGCVPLTVSFDNFSNFADSYLWTFPDSAGVVFQDTFNNQSAAPSVTFTVPGTYTVSMQAENACGSTEWTSTITVLEPPQLTLEPIPDVCESATLSLGDYISTEGDINSYDWMIEGPNGPTTATAENPEVLFPGPGDYSIILTVSNGYCEPATDTSALFIQQPDTVALELPSPGPICDASDPVSLTASPTGGFWTGAGIDSSGVFDPATVGLGAHSLQYQILDGACIYGDSLSVEVLLGQSVNTEEVLELCENDTIVGLQFSPSGGNWSGPGIIDANLGLFDPTSTGAGSFELDYELVDPSGCLITKNTMANVQALPLIAAPDTSIFCIDAGTIILQDELSPSAEPNGGTITWSGDFISDASNGTFNTPGEGSFPIQINYDLDQCATTTEIIVNILDPEEAVAGPDRSVCISENTLSLSGTPAGGQWTGPGVTDAFAGTIDLNIAGSGEHTYAYTLAEGSSCEVSDTVMVNIQGPGNLDAGLNLDFCSGDGQQSLPTPTPAGGQWSGPALVDPAQGLINTNQLTVDSTFWYNYSITNASTGCSFSDSVAVMVSPIPTVALDLPNYVCAQTAITLGTTPQANTTYTWNLNNETFSGDSISLNITESGSIPLSLTAQNQAGCTNSTNDDLQVASLPDPAFALDTPEGCGPLAVDFTDTSNGVDMQYNWDFGNGQESTQANPADIIFEPGIFDTTYLVQLEVSNACGQESYTDTVRVLARPVAGFGTPVDNGCGPLEISFANVTTGNADSYFWDFGNGNTSLDSLPDNQIFTTTDTAATTYQILLIATNSCGSDSIQRSILVEPSNVTPFFGVDDNQGCAPLTVQFNNYSSFGASVSWDFGDGNTAATANPVHTFDSAGYYTVYQYVNTACSSDSTMMQIEVLPSPEALFDHPLTICPDESIVFENQSSEFLTIFWDFGDGNNSTAISPEHTYAAPGTYPVTMVISNSAFLCQASHNSTVEVLERPSGSIVSEGGSGCPPFSICLEAETSGGSFFEWDFGDTNASTSLNPCHTFAESGNYNVLFRAADDNGCFSQADTISIRVFDEPEAAISIAEDLYCGLQQEIIFNNSSTGATNYEWTFSNGLNSALREPTITFTEAAPEKAAEKRMDEAGKASGGTWSGNGITTDGMFDPNLAGTGEHNLVYIIQDGACTYGAMELVAVVQSETTLATEGLNICENATPSPLSFSPLGGQWSGPGIIDATTGIFDPAQSGAGTFAVTYEYTDANGCFLARESTVEVQALPIIQAPDTSIFCIESETIILAQELTPSALPAGGDFSWSGTFIGDLNTGIFTPPGEGTHAIGLTYTYELCTVQTELYVNIADPGEAVAGPDQSVCITEGERLLVGSPAGGRWSGPGIVDPFSGVVDLNQAGSGAHEYIYTLADDSNCERSDVMQLEINGPGELEAGEAMAFCAGAGEQQLPVELEIPDYFCTNEDISIATAPKDGISYSWTVNGTNTYQGESISLNLSESGQYPIELHATNVAGCVSTAVAELRIEGLPAPSFELDTNEGCGPLTLDFTDASQGLDLEYSWEFSNGMTSSDANPNGITFEAGVFDTTYQVALSVRNACGEAHYDDEVTVLARPVANFGTPVNSGCGPLEINFANTTTGTADTYYWDFGNGNTSSAAIPENQVYTTSDSSATTYDIMLIVSNTCGNDTIQRPVTVEPANIIPFFNVSTTEGCEPLTVDFTDYSNYGATVSWDFGDGTTSTLTHPSHTFEDAGYYTVHQYVTTACGTDSTTLDIDVLPGPDAAFSHPPVVCPDDEIQFNNESSEFLTIFWDFGDGSTSTEAEPAHQFDTPGTYPVTMVVSNADYLCQSTYSSTVTILERPSGTILSAPDSGCPPFDVCLEAEFADASFFEWSFGDNNTSTTLNPCHTFTEPGMYTVSFRAANELGCYSTYDSVNVRVFDQPVAEIAAPQDLYCGVDQTIKFDNNNTVGATQFEWQFSNGLNSNLAEPTVNFSGSGNYTAELTVRNTFGCEDRASTSFIIAPQPMADFAPITNDGCVPEMVIFDNASVNVTKYHWDFGNGETTEEAHPTTLYRDPGSYNVKLVVSYDDLCFDSLSLDGSINLHSKPTAAFSWEYPTGNYQGIVQFINESENATQYRWDFSDGTISEEVHPLHDIGRNGNWQTELLAIDDNGCTDTTLVAFEPEVIYELFFPNALSPESGIGDVRVFKPAGIGLSDWTLEIFSPWGQRVYVSEEMEEDQPAAAWDGSFEGKILPQGAYSYKASVEFINGIRRVYTGSVTLVR